MNYLELYDRLISTRKHLVRSEYTETHHIVPKSLGGDDEKSNLIELLPREHFIAHLLLLKIQPTKSRNYYKMLNAFVMMCWCSSGNQDRYITSRLYEKLKKEFSNNRKNETVGSLNPSFGTMWISNPLTKQSTKIKKGDNIPQGFVVGRHRERKTCNGCGVIHYELTAWCKNCVSKKCQGNLNPNFGSVWITNETESRTIKKTDPVPDGWRRGRVVRAVRTA